MNNILKPLLFLAVFSGCYFVSCAGLFVADRDTCEETCSQLNSECSSNCKSFYDYELSDPGPSGNGCTTRETNCLNRCEDRYRKCIENCRRDKIEDGINYP